MNLDDLSKRVFELLRACLEQPPELRARWLEANCNEPEVRAHVLSLLGNVTVSDISTENRQDPAPVNALSPSHLGPPRYIFPRQVGRGGMSIVYEVFDTVLDRKVALKVLHYDGHHPGRFLNEARILGRLEHPSILPVHDLGIDPSGRLGFTMPLVKGRTFEDVIKFVKDGKEGWTIHRAAGVLLQVCQAVAHAHLNGVIHRDLKPANIMVGDLGAVYVLDWGLAKVLDQDEKPEPSAARGSSLLEPSHTQDGAKMGTPGYMSPEQAAKKHSEVDRRSDVFSLGVILQYLISGIRPSASPPAVEAASASNGKHPELAAIARRAMASEPDKRYSDAHEMAQDLQAYLDGRVVRAHATGAVVELKKWIRRNRGLASTIAALILVAFLGLLGVIAIQRKGQRETDQALAKANQNLSAWFLDRGTAALRERRYGDAAVLLGRSLELEDNPLARGHLYYARRFGPFTPSWASPVAPAIVESLAVSPDQKYLASGSRDHFIRLWNLKTFRIERILKAHWFDVWALAFHPSGKILASGSRDSSVILWDVASGEVLRKLEGHEDHVYAVAFSPEGDFLASSSRDGTVRTWSSTTGELHHVDTSHKGPVRALVVGPGGIIASGCDDGTVRIGSAQLSVDAPIRSLALHPRGDMLAATTEQGTVHLLSFPDTRRLAPPFECGEPVACSAFAKGGDVVVVGSQDGDLHVWDIRTSLSRRELRGHVGAILTLAALDGGRLFSGGMDLTIKLWHLDEGKLLASTGGHAKEILDVALSADGRHAVSASSDGTARIWDLDRGTEVRRLEMPAKASKEIKWLAPGYLQVPDPDRRRAVYAVAYTADGSLVAAGLADGTLRAWEPSTGKVAWNQDGDGSEVTDLAFRAKDNLLIAGNRKGVIRVFHQDGEEVGGRTPSVEHPYREWVFAISVDPTGRRMATGHGDGLILWRFDGHRSDQLVMIKRINLGFEVRSLAFSRDGDHLACGTAFDLRVYDSTGNQVCAVPSSGAGQSVAFSTTEKRIVSGDTKGSIYLWSVENFAHPRLLGRYQYGDRPILALALSPDGKRIMTSLGDPSLQAIDVPALVGKDFETKSPVLPGVDGMALHPERSLIASVALGVDLTGELSVHLGSKEENASSVAFSPTGDMLACGWRNGGITVWRCTAGFKDILEDRPLFKTTGSQVNFVAISRDGLSLLSGTEDRKLHVQDPQTGIDITPHRDLEHRPRSGAFSPDGRWLAVGIAGGPIHLWERSGSGRWPYWGDTTERRTRLTGHRGDVLAVTFSPDCKVLASASGDREIRLWDPQTGRTIQKLLGHGEEVLAVAYTPDGKLLASSSKDNTVRFWDLAGGKELLRIDPRGREFVTHSILFSRDGQTMYTGFAHISRPTSWHLPLLLSPLDGLREKIEQETGLHLEGVQVEPALPDRFVFEEPAPTTP